jgi:LmbE family N-acetylglucosaminyl deacetylase
MELCKEIARLIRIHRPDAIFSIDPGKDYMQWHKTDHRAAAFNTVDAIRAAQWPLYFPELLQRENLKAYEVPVCYFYYSVEPNYAVDIQEVEGLKLNAALSHESQFEPAIRKYQPMPEGARQMLTAGFQTRVPRRNGRCVEYFRRVDGGF